MTAIVEEWSRRLVGLAQDASSRPDPRTEKFKSAVAGLPPEHVELLASVNGATVYKGGFRLFGVREEPYLDLAAWNDPETWKFAWGDRIEPFVCFGETAWGDQYAYRRQSGTQQLSSEVYFLEGIALRPEVIAPNFGEFMETEFLRNASGPYDSKTIDATNRFGSIASDQHRVYVPSLALGGPESLENVISMPSVTAMTVAGDIATWISTAPDDAVVLGVEPWRDERGRDRLRVLNSYER